MKIYRLSKVAMFFENGMVDSFTTIYSFSYYRYRIEKKSIFKWKKLLDNIETKEEGMKILQKLKDSSFTRNSSEVSKC